MAAEKPKVQIDDYSDCFDHCKTHFSLLDVYYRYIVLACDGLWKKFKPEDCIAFTNKILEVSQN